VVSHAWQHYGPNGREGIHGLTKEAPVQMRADRLDSDSYGRPDVRHFACYTRFRRLHP